MPKALLIAEKPSLMRTIKDVYDKHKKEIPYDITFTSQRGHLVALKLPHEIDEEQKNWKWENLPFHPEQHGGWQYKIISEKKEGNNLTAKERYESIKKELKSGDYDFIINAGDPDQEGELLVRLVLAHMKNKLPVKRFWTNDLTETHVLNALKNLKDDDADPMCVNLYDAAKGRQHSDYRFGMNLSEAASLKMQARVACGRVKTPILAIVCKREDEIRNFVPSTAYGVRADYMEEFNGTLFDAATASTSDEESDEEQKSGIVWFDTKEEAEDLIKKLPNKATVVSFEKKRTETNAPKLFKLASLQVEAGKHGFNDAKTLQIIQGLYEKELLSYPRTDCEYLSSNEDFAGILKAVMAVPELNPYIKTISKTAIEKVRKSKRWINDKALEDAGHSAIRPTTKAANLASLTEEEKEIYSIVCRRFVAIFLPPIVQNKTSLVAEADGNTFRSTGKTLVDPGFSKIFGTKFTDMLVPEKQKGDILDVKEYNITEKTTTCPKRYTSPGLVEVCENPAKFLDDPSLKALGKRLKIGTSATRSAIIRQLIVKDKYLTEKKEKNTTYIHPTTLGEAIIRNLGSCDICKVDLTGIWEEKLEMIRQGKMSLDEFEDGMKEHVEQLIHDIKTKDMKTLSSPKYEVIGKCPKCGKDLCEGVKGYFCMGFRDTPKCGVGCFKEVAGAKLTKEDFADLMAGKEITKTLKKGTSKWKQKLKYNFDENKVDFVAGEEEKIGVCPKCGGDIVMSDRVFRCTGEDVKGFRSMLGTTFNGDEIMKMLRGETIQKELKKDKNKWIQPLTYDMAEQRIVFVKPKQEESDYKCPICGKKMMADAKKVSCSCGVTIWRNFFLHTLTDDEMRQLIEDGATDKIDGLKGKSGKEFSARAVFDKDEKRVKPDFS